MISLQRNTPVEQRIKSVELQQSLTVFCAKFLAKTDWNYSFSFNALYQFEVQAIVIKRDKMHIFLNSSALRRKAFDKMHVFLIVQY